MKNLIIIICLLVLVSGCATFKGQKVLAGNQEIILDSLGVIHNNVMAIYALQLVDKYQTTRFVQNVNSDWPIGVDEQGWFHTMDASSPYRKDPRTYPMVEIEAEPTKTEPSIRWLPWKFVEPDYVFKNFDFGLRDDGVVVWRERK